VKVNTVGGWREMRLSVFSKREPCRPARPVEWGERVLNEPAARVAWRAIAGCGVVVIGSSWARTAARLGLTAAGRPPLSVLADGARWVREQAARRFNGMGSCGRGVEWVVDVYHPMLYLHAFAAASRPGDAEAAAAWARGRVVELIEPGGPGFIGRLQGRGPGPDPPPAAAEAWGKLLKYLTDNRDSLWYGDRLKRGQPIGTGLIEGGCKNIIAARLKLNPAETEQRPLAGPPGRADGRDPLPPVQQPVGGVPRIGAKTPACRHARFGTGLRPSPFHTTAGNTGSNASHTSPGSRRAKLSKLNNLQPFLPPPAATPSCGSRRVCSLKP
jgi:hypothetical protein